MLPNQGIFGLMTDFLKSEVIPFFLMYGAFYLLVPLRTLQFCLVHRYFYYLHNHSIGLDCTLILKFFIRWVVRNYFAR